MARCNEDVNKKKLVTIGTFEFYKFETAERNTERVLMSNKYGVCYLHKEFFQSCGLPRGGF